MVALATVCCLLSSAAASDLSDKKRAVIESFHAWRFEESRVLVSELKQHAPDDPDVIYLDGELNFYEGNYAEAVKLIDKAIETGSNPARYQSMRDVVAATFEVTEDYELTTSPDGRFTMRHPKGKDVVLSDFAFDALGAAYDAFAHDFGVDIPTPIRIEVYPSAADLARVSSLTEEDIRTSGTIALCKYNRLMLTSPRALMRGYGWLDTLVHEYAHLVINRAGHGKVPIWLHEGLAKFSERRWRGGDDVRQLPPYSEWLLDKRANEGNIVTFDQMHPSMAKLPSQEDAAMAFAEVYAAIEMLHGAHGIEGIQSMLQQVGGGVSVEDAVSIVHGDSWDGFEKDWQAHLLSRTRRYEGSEPPDIFEQVAFKKKISVGATDADELDVIPEDEARKWVHLGDILYGKQRLKAAAVEYRKAVKAVGDTNPVLQVRIGRVLVETGQYEEAVAALMSAVDDGETYVTLYVYLGAALVAMEKYNEAYEWLQEAAAINPFDPSIHRSLARVYDHQGQTERAERARNYARLVVE